MAIPAVIRLATWLRAPAFMLTAVCDVPPPAGIAEPPGADDPVTRHDGHGEARHAGALHALPDDTVHPLERSAVDRRRGRARGGEGRADEDRCQQRPDADSARGVGRRDGREGAHGGPVRGSVP